VTGKELAEGRQRMAQAVRDGAEPGAVARQHLVSIATVRNACGENGVDVPRRVSIKHVSILPVIADLLLTSDSYRAIGQRHRRIPCMVGYYAAELRKLGVPLPVRPRGRQAKPAKQKKSLALGAEGDQNDATEDQTAGPSAEG